LKVTTSAKTEWLQKNNVFGTFDWKTTEYIATISPDAEEIRLILGLENTSGTVWFDEVSLQIIGEMRKRPTTTVSNQPVYKGHDRSRLRGAMIGTNVDEKDIHVLGGEWKANHIRWQLLWGGFPNGPADTATSEQYHAWLESEMQRLERLLPVCEKLGMLVVIDLHTPPGGRDTDANMPLFQKKELQELFMQVWDEIAVRFKENKAVWGYDLLNEPCEGIVGDDVMTWRELAEETAKRIRKIDAERAIIIEPAPWGSPDSLDWFEPLNDIANVVYSVHVYLPHSFTHQGVHSDSPPIFYPGQIDGKDWNKEQLRKALEPVTAFQKDHHVHMYIGEFSAIRWAPERSAENYLRDCLEIFEENGWDWAYHAFREWDGWSVEHTGPTNATQRAALPTERQQLLMRYFQK
jgi:aryl-phospho-beta-D-glucosidase BglC (GH1 family)